MKIPYHPTTEDQLERIIDNPYRVYLLYGQKNIGKYLTAREIAAKLLSEHQIAKSVEFASPNLLTLESLIDKEIISIDQIRGLLHKVWRTAVDHNSKVVIIRGVEKLTESAANALLKNLEDLSPRVTYLLLSDSLANVLVTIKSRSQLVYFSEANNNRKLTFITECLNCNIDEAQSKLTQAKGNLLTALQLSDKEANEIYKYATKYIDSGITQRFNIAKHIAEQKCISLFLEELIYAIRSESTILNEAKLLENIIRAQEQLEHNINARLVLENMSLR